MAGALHRSWLGLVYADLSESYHRGVARTTRVVPETGISSEQGRYDSRGHRAGFIRSRAARRVPREIPAERSPDSHVYWRARCLSADRLSLASLCHRFTRK